MTGDASGGGSRISEPVRTCPLGSFEGPSSHCSWAADWNFSWERRAGTGPSDWAGPPSAGRHHHPGTRIVSPLSRPESVVGSSLCENSDVELARRKFVSITLNKKRTALAVTVERRKERKQFCAFSARARFHTAWTHLRHSRSQPTSSWHEVYFTTRCFVGAIAAGADGEMVNVSQVFHPDGRLAAPNSLYPLRLREPCMSPTGKLYPICGPTPKTRDLKPPRIGFWPESSVICW